MNHCRQEVDRLSAWDIAFASVIDSLRHLQHKGSLVPIFPGAMNPAAACAIRCCIRRAFLPRACVIPDGAPIPTTSTLAPELILPHDDWSSTARTNTVKNCRYGVFTFHRASSYIPSSRLLFTRTLTSTRRLSSRPSALLLRAIPCVLP